LFSQGIAATYYGVVKNVRFVTVKTFRILVLRFDVVIAKFPSQFFETRCSA